MNYLKCWNNFPSECSLCSGPKNIESGPWINGRKCLDQMNHNFSFITSMFVSGYAIFQEKHYALEDIFMDDFWTTLVVAEQTMKDPDYLTIIAGQLHP